MNTTSLRRLRPDHQTSQLEHKIAMPEMAAQTPPKTIHVHVSETWALGPVSEKSVFDGQQKT